jgi:hypothetical protein
MKAETPAQGILKLNEWGSSKMYKVVCDCGDDTCTHTIDVEADDYSVTVIIYTEQKTPFWNKTRWQHIWQLLTTGQARFETAIVLKEQVALNYAEVLKSAIEDVKEFRKKQNVKN